MITACQKMKVQFTYEKFLHAVKEQKDKFRSISNMKAGEPFSEKLFSAFFALHVIPIRANLFPNLHAEKEKAIERYEKIKAELEAKEKEEKAELEAKEKEEKAKQKRMEPILEAIIAYGAAHER